MDSYERVIAAVDYRRPDRPPLNYYGTPETDRMLMDALGCADREALLCELGADMRYVGAEYVGPDRYTGVFTMSTDGTDMWGIRWAKVPNAFCTYCEIVDHPLAGAATVRDVRDYAWPSPDWLSFGHLKDDIARLNDPNRRAIVFAPGSFLETAWALRGFEQFLLDMLESPELADAILAQVVAFYRSAVERALENAQGGIDILWNASDLGMQQGLMFSVETWRQLIMPHLRQLIEPFRSDDLRMRYHTDGNVEPIIEDLIDLGVQLLDPIQPGSPGMEPRNLAKRFAGRLAFYGGVDTQHLLPYGSPAQVQEKVLELIETLGPRGGYIVAASNAVQPDVPLENILTLYRTAREYRYS